MIRRLIRRWLGIEAMREEIGRQERRIGDIARHFVTQRDPRTGQPMETLADRHAKEDGKPEVPKVRRSNNWNLTRRRLEAAHAGVKQVRLPASDGD